MDLHRTRVRLGGFTLPFDLDSGDFPASTYFNASRSQWIWCRGNIHDFHDFSSIQRSRVTGARLPRPRFRFVHSPFLLFLLKTLSPTKITKLSSLAQTDRSFVKTLRNSNLFHTVGSINQLFIDARWNHLRARSVGTADLLSTRGRQREGPDPLSMARVATSSRPSRDFKLSHYGTTRGQPEDGTAEYAYCWERVLRYRRRSAPSPQVHAGKTCSLVG